MSFNFLICSFIGIGSAFGDCDADLKSSFLYQPAYCIDDALRGPAEAYIPQPGDIFLCTDSGLAWRLGHMLAMVGPPHHSGIVVARPDGSMAVMEAGPFRSEKVEIQDLVPTLQKYAEHEKVWIRRRCVPLTADQSACLTAFAMSQEGKRFAMLRILVQLTPLRPRGPVRSVFMGKPQDNRIGWICSELVTQSCVVAGLIDPDTGAPPLPRRATFSLDDRGTHTSTAISISIQDGIPRRAGLWSRPELHDPELVKDDTDTSTLSLSPDNHGIGAALHVAKTLKDWIETDVAAVSAPEKRRWLGEEFFFRDPLRPMYTDTSYFFSPGDGVILYQKRVAATDPIVDIKGIPYSLRDALRSPCLEGEYLVIGIFMTVYDVHINRIPYAGNLSYRSLPAIETYNWPMLGVEAALLANVGVWAHASQYLHNNQRMLNRIVAANLSLVYYLLQIADYDVRCIMPFELKQHARMAQNKRFSQVRFGSQIDLIIPTANRLDLQILQDVGVHVQAGIDPLVRVVPRKPGREPPLGGHVSQSEST